MMSHDVTAEYRALIESLEIPNRTLPATSARTPEVEVLNDIRRHFNIPPGIDTRAPLVDYLSSNVRLDDFFSFMGFLIRPFARMVVEIYDFLSRFERTAASAQTITEIRIGSRTPFPVNLKFLPPEVLSLLTWALDEAWNFDSLWPLHNQLPALTSIARCDGKYGANRCRPDCFQHCRAGIASVVEDVESILRADEKNAGSPAVAGAPRLDSALRKTFEDFLQESAVADPSTYKAASDCIPGQAPGRPPAELYTQKAIRAVQDVLEDGTTQINVLREEIHEFLKLPYWRRRNDLYEVWVLTKVCGLFPAHRVQLCNLDAGGRWKIPGNGQGRIDEPVLKLAAPSGNYRVYTGLNLRGYQHPEEKAGRVRGGMPDWLFCREVDDFDFDLFNDESSRFRSEGVVPEFIVECKAGASYGLADTVERTMKPRYLPLLRTDRGRAVLVNYRQFYVPAKLDSPTYRHSISHLYTRILAVDSLTPEASSAEDEFLQAARETFGLNVNAGKKRGGPVDLMLVVDTTGSMEAYLDSLRNDGWEQCVTAVSQHYGDVRFGVVAVGDHGLDGYPDVYDVLLSPLADGEQAVAFLANVAGTRGDDTPEAYEDALHALAALPWRAVAARLVIFLGDAYPHPAAECPLGFDWEAELSLLKNIGVIIHGVRIPGELVKFPDEEHKSVSFFKRICSETGGNFVEVASGPEVVGAILDCVGVS